MKHFLFACTVVALSALAWADAPTPPEGFVALFDGKSLDGWSGDERLWSVKDGMILGSTEDVKIEHNTFLSYPKEYSDFVLQIKVKLRNHNSGIQFRSDQLPDYVLAGYQADVAEKTYFGMLYEEKKRGILPYWNEKSQEERDHIQEIVKKDDWNQYEITCQGDHITMVLNGVTTCDLIDPDGAKRGIIGLQLHAGDPMRVAFKDIFIKELPGTGATLDKIDDATRRERLAVTGDRWRLPEGFTVEEVATNDLVGSVINMTFDHKGRPVVASENKGIFILLDTDNDGIYDAQHAFTEDIGRAMGMHYLGAGDLLVHAIGPEDSGLYRVIDHDGDDVADEIITLDKSNGGIGEHGPHAILTGPDGFLYILFGNHSHPGAQPSTDSPLRGMQEDFLLPRIVDPRGHANNIRAPGGTILRLNPETGEWSLVTGGFRNAFDMAMNDSGEILTFDSDMEWDYGLPWYRPIRIAHAIPGADFGWRTGSSKMPFYYIDTLPSVDDVGRGSPVGTAFYQHTRFPEKYHGALFMGDWSRGRIRVIFPQADGATYSGKTEDFVLGEPLNVTDLDVAPDGNLYFTVGGRGTHGGMFRVIYGDDVPLHDPTESLEDLTTQPMPRSAWGEAAILRAKDKLGDRWEPSLTKLIRDPKAPGNQRARALEYLTVYGPKPFLNQLVTLAEDKDPAVRAFAVFLLGTHPLAAVREALTRVLSDEDPVVARRACEALVRAGLDGAAITRPSDTLVEGLLNLLNHEDTFVRYAARNAIERVNRDAWASAILESDPVGKPHLVAQGLLALIHTQRTPGHANDIFRKLLKIADGEYTVDQALDFLRVLQLAYIRDLNQATDKDPNPRKAFSEAIAPKIAQHFPSEDPRLNRELQVVLAHMQYAPAIEPMLDYLTLDKPQEEQIHTVYCLRAIKEGWTAEQRARLVDWFDTGRELGGAASMEGYIDKLWQDTLALLPEDERIVAEGRKAEALKKRQEAALALMEQLQGENAGTSELAQMSFEEMADYLEYDPMAYRADLEQGKNIFIRSRCASCHVFGKTGKGGGPDLSSVVSRFRRRDILEAIMYPSKTVSDQYSGVEVDLEDFSQHIGMIITEDEETLTLITIYGERIEVKKSEIEERRESTASMMPEGLLHTMSLGELVALINYLEKGAEM